MSDIKGQFTADNGGVLPDGFDDGYDLYVETLRDRRTFDQTVYGVINIGDLYQGVFTWDGRDWHDSPEDPHVMLDRITKHREFDQRYQSR